MQSGLFINLDYACDLFKEILALFRGFGTNDFLSVRVPGFTKGVVEPDQGHGQIVKGGALCSLAHFAQERDFQHLNFKLKHQKYLCAICKEICR